jgi:hypothetical protein
VRLNPAALEAIRMYAGFSQAELARHSGLSQGHSAPRGAIEPCGDERAPLLARRSGPIEAEGSLTPGARGRAASSPDEAGAG